VSSARQAETKRAKPRSQRRRAPSGMTDSGTTEISSTTAARAVTAASSWVFAARSGLIAALDWTRETITPIGWQSLTLLGIGVPVGIIWKWPEFLIMGLVSGLLAVAAIPFLFGGKNYAVNFKLPDDRIVAGTETTAIVEIQNNSNRLELPGQLDVPIGPSLSEIPIPLMRSGQIVEIKVPIPTQRRGVLDVGPISTVRTDLVGVLRRELRWADVKKLYVHPQTVTIRSTTQGIIRDLEGSPTTNLVDSDMSFHAIREYQPGDGQRHIHWKSTAKTGKLMVRQFEESRRSRMALILASHKDEYDPTNADEFELAVSALGSLGSRAIQDGRDVSVIAGLPETIISEKTVRRIRSLNTMSSRKLLDDLCVVDTYQYGLKASEICRMATRDLSDMSLAVVICGSTTKLRDMSRIRLQLPAEIGVLFVNITPGSEPAYRSFSSLNVVSIAVLDDLAGMLARMQ
jgi:uncharacterized protein (DUF58 family)